MTFNVDGTVTYDPSDTFEDIATGESAVETFTYAVTDGNDGSDVATVAVTVIGENDGPAALDDSGSVSEDGPGIVIDALANDSDVDASDTIKLLSIDTTGT